MRYDYTVLWTEGKKMVVADALSRGAVKIIHESEELSSKVEAHVQMIVNTLPIKDKFLNKIIEEQLKDPICKKLRDYALTEWPDKSKIPFELTPYYQFRHSINVTENILLNNTRVIIPPTLQSQVLTFIHYGHQGIVKCRERAKVSVWWFGLSTQIEKLVRECPNCIQERTNPREPFLKAELPERPWEFLAVDLFKYKQWYLIVTDYYSKYFEIVPLNQLTEQIVIAELKSIFARFGVPEVLRSDNGTQFKKAFSDFATKYNFNHVTSSPYFSQSNAL